MDILHAGGHIGSEFADNLFENILQCHQSLNITIFVNNKGDAALLALEVQQLRVERCIRRNGVRFAGNLQQQLFGELTFRQDTQSIACMYKADNIVDVVTVDWEAGVLAMGELAKIE